MKKSLYTIITICIITGISACTKILDKAPANKISSATMWSTESLVDQGVIGVYYSLQRPVNSSGLVGSATTIGYYGYEAFGMTGQGEYNMANLFSSAVKPGNGYFSHHWKWCYDGIHRANDAIAHIPDAPMKEEKKNRLIAEMKVLRAFFYMRLTELFGTGGIGVPIYIEPINPSEANKTQSPESEVWDQIIKDLTDAVNESALPNNQIQGEGRVSKGAAYAFRGKAYLITKQYQKAADDFKKVGECGYALYPNYRQLFKVAQERCEEMILSVQYIEEPSGYGSSLQKFQNT